jgi:DNA polymerase-3 subunit alpha
VVLSGYHNASAQADFELGEDWQVNAIPELLRTVRGMPGVLAAGVRLVKTSNGE